MNRAILGKLLSIAMVAFASLANAQDYPNKIIKMVVPYPPGGTTDALARLVAEKVRAKWGQTVVIENRGGAGGNIGAEAVWRSPPDGYTLMFASPGPLAINKSLYPKLSYEPETFAPVSLIAATPNVLVVNPKVNAETLPQLISFAKDHPDQLSYASQGAGSTSHLTAELFKSSASVKLTHVPYKGSSPAIGDLLGGQVDIMFVELSSVLPHIKSGSLRLLGVGGDKRHPLFPNVPAITEVLPGFASSTWFALAAPPGTPQPIVDKLSAAVAEIVKQPDMTKRFSELSVDAVGSNPADMTVFTKKETERWRKVIQITGTTIE